MWRDTWLRSKLNAWEGMNPFGKLRVVVLVKEGFRHYQDVSIIIEIPIRRCINEVLNKT
jgi:hypothetical protein